LEKRFYGFITASETIVTGGIIFPKCGGIIFPT
jgi:hypothetical protein